MLNKKIFYLQLKEFSKNKLPIYVSMQIDIDSKYKINLAENRITTDKINFNPNFTLQIIDITKTGINKYVCKDIEFNLIKENITSDYKLYKYIDNILIKKLKNKVGVKNG